MNASRPNPGERVLDVRFTEDTLAADLADGRTIIVPLVWYPRLLSASLEQRSHISIEPTTGKITESYPTSFEPRRLALSPSASQLYYSAGQGTLEQLGYGQSWLRSESIRSIDLATGASGSPFWPSIPGVANSGSTVIAGRSSGVTDLVVLPGEPAAVAVLSAFSTTFLLPDGFTSTAGLGRQLTVHDGGPERAITLDAASGLEHCTAIQPGSTAAQLYCWSGAKLFKLALTSERIASVSSTPVPPGNGSFGGMLFREGRIYAENGLVIDAETGNVIGAVQAQGPVTVTGNRVYWLDPFGSNPGKTVILRAFDKTTLTTVDTKEIGVTSTELALTRLVPCGGGRVAFHAGHEIYIVTP